MVAKTHGTAYRWFINLIIIVTAVAFGATTWALYSRFHQSTERFHAQREVNNQLTCAIIQMLRNGADDLDNPNSATYKLYVRLGFDRFEIQAASRAQHQNAEANIDLLPAHPPCATVP